MTKDLLCRQSKIMRSGNRLTGQPCGRAFAGANLRVPGPFRRGSAIENAPTGHNIAAMDESNLVGFEAEPTVLKRS
jgi:hypothetical protein